MAHSDEEFEAIYAGCEISIHVVDGGWNIDFKDEEGDPIIVGFLPFIFGTFKLLLIKDVIEYCIELM
jgi:hypothetical protein